VGRERREQTLRKGDASADLVLPVGGGAMSSPEKARFAACALPVLVSGKPSSVGQGRRPRFPTNPTRRLIVCRQRLILGRRRVSLGGGRSRVDFHSLSTASAQRYPQVLGTEAKSPDFAQKTAADVRCLAESASAQVESGTEVPRRCASAPSRNTLLDCLDPAALRKSRASPERTSRVRSLSRNALQHPAATPGTAWLCC